MFISVHSAVRGGALAVAATAFFLLPHPAQAQFGFPAGGFGGGGFNRGFGGGFGGGQPGLVGANPGAIANQNAGIQANQSNTRSRFALNTSITGAGVLNASLDPVTQFGTALNTGNQTGMGGGGGFGNTFNGGFGVNGAQGFGLTQNGLGTLTKQPPGVVINAMYNGSTSYGIFGNQQVQGYGGATPQVGFGGGFGGFPGGFGGFPGGGFGGFGGKGGFGNGDYGY